MDRNSGISGYFSGSSVALLAEGVDRNLVTKGETTYDMSVALLAEGVDRNLLIPQGQLAGLMSPSSRRAWIEIPSTLHTASRILVALLAEGVDRNCACLAMSSFVCASPSSRRAWIEMRR